MTKGKDEVNDDDILSNTDQVDNVYSNLIGDFGQPKRCADKTMIHDDQSTIHLGDNNSTLLAPPVRQYPNELVSLIIGNLSYEQTTLYACTLACRQLYAIANPILWKTLKLGDYMQCERFFTCLFDAFIPPRRQTILKQYIRHLRLDGYFWTDARLTRLLPHIPLVEKVILGSRTRITDNSFQRLPYYCQHLSSLTLYDINQLTDVSFAIMGRYCKRLCELQWDTLGNGRLAWVALLTLCPLERLGIRLYHYALDEDIMAILKKFDHLTCLEISQMVDTSYNIISKATNDCMNLLLVPTTIRAHNHHDDTTTTTTTSSCAETNLWPQLKQLILDPCGNMDDTTLVPFIKTHCHLQVLRLTESPHLTDDSVEAMAQWLPNLVELRLTGNDNITPNSIRRLIHQCSHLTGIELNFCRNILPPSSFPELFELSRLGFVKFGPREIDMIKQTKMTPPNGND